MKFRSLQNLFAINKNAIPICQAMPEKKEATRWEGDWIRFEGFRWFYTGINAIHTCNDSQTKTYNPQPAFLYWIDVFSPNTKFNWIRVYCYNFALSVRCVFLYLFYFHSSFEWFVSAKYSWFVRDSPVPLISFHYRMLSLHRNAMRKINQKYWVEKGIQ